MRLKYYLRGAGIGIIITTLILTLAFAFSKDNKSLSDEEVLKRAAELGYVPADAGIEPEKQDVEKEDKKDNTSSENSNEDNKTIDAFVDNTETEDDADQVVNYVAFTVSGGESSNTVALHLQEAGLVDDAEAFNDYMNKLGVDNLIQGGTFYVADNSSYEDLIAILVTKQDKRMTSPPKNN